MHQSLLLYLRFLVTIMVLPLSFLASAQITPTGGIVYVTQGGTGNGSSWGSATADLQGAINANGVTKVFVAIGVYPSPDPTTGSKGFRMKNNVAIYGGFDPGSGITDLSHNRIMPNPANTQGSVLTGQNNRRVVSNDGDTPLYLNNTAILDGFTIMNGKHSGIGGAGIYNWYSSPALNNLVIRNNNGGQAGGGMMNSFGSPVVTNTVFLSNTSVDGGSAIYNSTISATPIKPVFINVTIVNNTSTDPYSVGPVWNSGNGPDAVHVYFYNSIISGNSWGKSGITDIANDYQAKLTIKNSITQSYDTGNPADNNLVGINPKFTDAASGNFTLQFDSDAANKGSNALYTGLTANTKDLAGNPRVHLYSTNGVIDMGAYESTYTPIVPASGIVYVRPTAFGKQDGSSWADATDNLPAAIHVSSDVQKVFVAVGTYKAPATSFRMKNNVAIYGGFDPANGITTLAHNRRIPSETVSGSVLTGENARRIISNDFTSGNGLNASAVLDGFTIANGYILTSGLGAGMYNKNASPTLNNLVFRDNNVATSSGAAGMYNVQNSSPAVTNTLFLNNKAGNIGGAVCNVENCSPTFTNVIFKGNEAYLSSVMDNNLNSSPVLKNVLITGNKSNNIINTNGNSSISLINVTMANNYNRNGELPASIYTGDNSTITIINSIIFETMSGAGASSSQYSFIKGNTNTSNGNINTADINLTDIFTNPSTGDYSLKFSSILNKGNNALFPDLDATTKDLAGKPRLVGATIDLGAYEYPYNVIPDANGIVYVRQVALGKKDGSSWDDATNDLHNAIQAGGVKKVFVAIGTYNVGDHSFIMKNGVEIYGGFDPGSGITNLSHNRIMPDPFNNYAGSILNGQEVRPVIWNVFTSGTALNSTAVLDGFTIANGAYTDGAGIRNVYASPTLNNLVIRGNKATVTGGGIYNQHSNTVITNTVFKGNSVVSPSGDAFGGAMYNTNSSPVITNATFVGNLVQRAASGTENGAGIYNLNSSPKIYNSIFWSNMKMMTGATAGVDIQNSGSGTVTLKNSITQNYTTGVATDNNKVNVNPLFVNVNGSYALQLSSPAIGAGSNALYTGLNAGTRDLAGNPRLSGTTVDIGAYEYQLSVAAANGIVYVKPAPSGNGSGDSWINATNLLQDAIDASGTQKVFVAVGNYNAGNASFVMKNGVAIYGGFDPASGITDLTHDRILPNKGMEDGSVLNGQNTRPIIWNTDNGLNNTAVLDGFTLINGKGNHGGAIYNFNTAPAFRNLFIRNNTAVTSGGGIYNVNAPITLSNSIIKDNTALYGGGIRNNGSASVLTNVTITGNSATMATTGAGGGGIFNENSALALTNVVIANNSTSFKGGGFRNLSGNPALTNVTLANNTAENNTETAAMYIEAGTPQLNNTIVYGTVDGIYTAHYSLIEGNADFTNGNLDATEITVTDIFTDAANGDYTLLENSPVIDAGNNALFAGLDENTKDLADNPRVYNSGIIDLGAYEYQGLKIITSVAEQKNKSLSIQIYPNPATEQITISDLKGNEIITIYDATGTMVTQLKGNTTETTIALDHLNAGIYHVRITAETTSVTSVKFMIVK